MLPDSLVTDVPYRSRHSRRSTSHWQRMTRTFPLLIALALPVLVTALKAEGCNALDKIEGSEYGKFAWVIDPEGNRVELWQPAAGQ